MPDLSNYPTGLFIQNPTEIQSRRTQTIQTHNAVSVPATTGQSASSWYQSDGYDKIAVGSFGDVSYSGSIQIGWSSDGITVNFYDIVQATSTTTTKGGIVDVKMPYFRVIVLNADTSARTVSTWAYLKA